MHRFRPLATAAVLTALLYHPTHELIAASWAWAAGDGRRHQDGARGARRRHRAEQLCHAARPG